MNLATNPPPARILITKLWSEPAERIADGALDFAKQDCIGFRNVLVLIATHTLEALQD